LCQPWFLTLHIYGFSIILFGLIGFIVFSHIQPLPEEEES
jgi:preprotein translocase subunit Sss1